MRAYYNCAQALFIDDHDGDAIAALSYTTVIVMINGIACVDLFYWMVGVERTVAVSHIGAQIADVPYHSQCASKCKPMKERMKRILIEWSKRVNTFHFVRMTEFPFWCIPFWRFEQELISKTFTLFLSLSLSLSIHWHTKCTNF